MKKFLTNYALHGFIVGYLSKHILNRYIFVQKSEPIVTIIEFLPIIGLFLGIYLEKRNKTSL